MSDANVYIPGPEDLSCVAATVHVQRIKTPTIHIVCLAVQSNT